MPKIEKITKQTENPYVNLYLVEGKNKVDHLFRYYVASRAKTNGSAEDQDEEEYAGRRADVQSVRGEAR